MHWFTNIDIAAPCQYKFKLIKTYVTISVVERHGPRQTPTT